MVLLTAIELGIRLGFNTVYTIAGYSYRLIFGRTPSHEEQITLQILEELRSLRRETRMLKDQLNPPDPEIATEYDMVY